jgi:hypothetical protein
MTADPRRRETRQAAVRHLCIHLLRVNGRMEPAAEQHGQRWPKPGLLSNSRGGGGFKLAKFHAWI